MAAHWCGSVSFLPLTELRTRIEEHAARIGAPPDALPTYGTSDGLATPHLEVHAHATTAATAVTRCVGAALARWGWGVPRWPPGYHLVIAERGEEYSRRVTADLDELLYWVLTDVAHATAIQRGRRAALSAAERLRWEYGEWGRLMGVLEPRWAVRWRQEQAAVLAHLDPPPPTRTPVDPP